jgi:hypothetical protein
LGHCELLSIRSGLSDTQRAGVEARNLRPYLQRSEGQRRKRQNARQYLLERLDLPFDRSALHLGRMLLRLNVLLLPGLLSFLRKPCLLSRMPLHLSA